MSKKEYVPKTKSGDIHMGGPGKLALILIGFILLAGLLAIGIPKIDDLLGVSKFINWGALGNTLMLIFIGPFLTFMAWSVYKAGEVSSYRFGWTTYTRKNDPITFWGFVVFFGTLGVAGWVVGWVILFMTILSWFGLVDKP